MDLNPRGWRRPIWLLLLVAASVAFTFTFACAAPFAAFAAASACTLPRRDAYSVAGAVGLSVARPEGAEYTAGVLDRLAFVEE